MKIKLIYANLIYLKNYTKLYRYSNRNIFKYALNMCIKYMLNK